MTTLRDILDICGFDTHNLQSCYGEEKTELLLDSRIEVHTQYNWPLKAGIENVRMLDGKLVFAHGTASEYGSKDAWEEGEMYNNFEEDWGGQPWTESAEEGDDYDY